MRPTGIPGPLGPGMTLGAGYIIVKRLCRFTI